MKIRNNDKKKTDDGSGSDLSSLGKKPLQTYVNIQKCMKNLYNVHLIVVVMMTGMIGMMFQNNIHEMYVFDYTMPT